MANRPGHKRILGGSTERGPYLRKHFLGTKRQEVEGLVFRDTYRTLGQEMYDFIGPIPSKEIQVPLINNVTNADLNQIGTTGTAVAIFRVPRAGLISAVSYGSNTAFTQNGTNFFTFTSNITRTSTTVLSVVAHANSTDSNAAAINGGVNLVANTDYALALSAAATRYVNAGDVIVFTATVTGTLAAKQDAPYLTITLQYTDDNIFSKAVATAGQPLLVRNANTARGEALLQLDATSEAQTAAYTWGDQLNFYKPDLATPVLGDGPFFEATVKVGANASVSTNDTVVIGVATAFNNTFASITKYAWFKLTGNMNVVLESADGTTTNTAVAPTIGTTTLTAGTYYFFTIDFSDPTAVAFWYDDGKNDIFLGTLSMAALATTDLFQPFIAVQRSSGTDAVDVTVDLLSMRFTRY